MAVSFPTQPLSAGWETAQGLPPENIQASLLAPRFAWNYWHQQMGVKGCARPDAVSPLVHQDFVLAVPLIGDVSPLDGQNQARSSLKQRARWKDFNLHGHPLTRVRRLRVIVAQVGPPWR